MAAQKKNPGGRPPKYTDPEELKAKIEEYFEMCEGELLRNADGDPVLDRFQQPIFLNRKQPTSAGLARALGFGSRKSLFDYKGKKQFEGIIKNAMLYLEEKTEERLFDKDGANGAKFSLQNNFRWRDGNKDDAEKAPSVTIINDIPRTVPVKAVPDGESSSDGSSS